MDCLVLPGITSRISQVNVDKGLITLPEDNKIADPDFDKSGEIDLLIGGLFWNLLCGADQKRTRTSDMVNNSFKMDHRGRTNRCAIKCEFNLAFSKQSGFMRPS